MLISNAYEKDPYDINRDSSLIMVIRGGGGDLGMNENEVCLYSKSV